MRLGRSGWSRTTDLACIRRVLSTPELLTRGTALASRTPSTPLIRRHPTTGEMRRVDVGGTDPPTSGVSCRRSATELHVRGLPLSGWRHAAFRPSPLPKGEHRGWRGFRDLDLPGFNGPLCQLSYPTMRAGSNPGPGTSTSSALSMALPSLRVRADCRARTGNLRATSAVHLPVVLRRQWWARNRRPTSPRSEC